MFDPFARRKKIPLAHGDRVVQTTPGQMNFFRWAITNGVVDYAVRNIAEIRGELPKCHHNNGRAIRVTVVKRTRKRCRAADLGSIVRPKVITRRRFLIRFK
eukprot:jgi/Mesvir1/21202/Mv21549-RA.1